MGRRRKEEIARLAEPEHRVADVDEELDFHLQGRVEELVAAGWSADDARAEAVRQFGDPARYRDECRSIARERIVRERRGEMWERIGQDVRFALRSFRRSPGFATVSIVTLGLGIGATTAVFTVAKNVVFDPLPFERPEELVMVYEQNRSQNIARDFPSPPNYADWLAGNRSFEDLAAMGDGSVTLSGIEQPRVLEVAYVTPNTFSVLGVEARVGRTFSPRDRALSLNEDVASASTAIISDGAWRSIFGGDPAVVGRTIRLNDVPVEVVGVMPPTFTVPRADVDVWLPVDYTSSAHDRQSRYLRVFGRLAPNVTSAQAEADLDRIQAVIAQSEPEANQGWTVDVVPVQEEVVGTGARTILLLLLGAVGFVLLIACTNVANLLLGRSTTREREISVRTALGASRRRVLHQLLTESLVLGLLGGALGVGLAYVGVDLLLRLEPADLPRIREVGVDGASLVFALASALLTAVLFGLVPALHAARGSVSESLKGTSSVGGRSERARSVLVVLEVAVSLVLLVGAGLLGRSLLRLHAVDPGFASEGVTIARVNLGSQDYPTSADRIVYFEEMLRRLRSTTGVAQAGVTSTLPMDPAGIDFDLPYLAEGQPARPEQELPQMSYRIVSEGYFEALGIEVVRGRSFDALDRAETRRVLVVNETFTEQLWPGEDAIGKTVTIYYVDDTPWEVVGVVEDTRHGGLGAPAPAQMYVPLTQAEVLFGYMHFAVRTTGDADITSVVRSVGAEVDPKYPLYSVSTMRSLLAASTEQDRFVAVLLGAFALLALCLATVGIHGVVAYQVARRTREIGLRMALGAERARVLRSVLGRAATLAGLGIALGAIGAAVATRVVRGLLYEVSPLDPITFAGVGAMLLAAALVSALVPALRASKMDPAGALRND